MPNDPDPITIIVTKSGGLYHVFESYLTIRARVLEASGDRYLEYRRAHAGSDKPRVCIRADSIERIEEHTIDE